MPKPKQYTLFMELKFLIRICWLDSLETVQTLVQYCTAMLTRIENSKIWAENGLGPLALEYNIRNLIFETKHRQQQLTFEFVLRFGLVWFLCLMSYQTL